MQRIPLHPAAQAHQQASIEAWSESSNTVQIHPVPAWRISCKACSLPSEPTAGANAPFAG
ncbi:hypothetical protein D1872_196100 [compost metagenome]